MGSPGTWSALLGQHRQLERSFTTVHLTAALTADLAGLRVTHDAQWWCDTSSHVSRLDVDGELWHLNDGRQAYVNNGDGSFSAVSRFAPVALGRQFVLPHRLIGGDVSILNGVSAEATAAESPVETFAGRRAQPVTLSSGSSNMYVEIDLETAVLLAFRSPVIGVETTVATIEYDAPIAEQVLSFPPDLNTTRRATPQLDFRFVETMRMVTPQFWPTGVGYSVIDADESTGEIVATLDVPDRPILHRWRGGATALLERREWANGLAERYDWSDDTWHWRLLSRTAISAADLETIKASMQ